MNTPRFETINNTICRMVEPEPLSETEPCDVCAGTGMISCEACNATGLVPITQLAKEPIANCENCKHVCTNSNIDHCHMYEPQPYAVGDWVEFIDAGSYKSQGKYLSDAYENTILVLDTIYNMRCVVPTSKITRKLDPSEVFVRIGCLKGTVEKASDYAYFLLWHSREDCDYSMIKWSALDTPTHELVKDLLEKQGEEA